MARNWSQTMAKTGNYDHRPSFKWMTKAKCRTAGENIHSLDPVFASDLAGIAVEDWMWSFDHRAAILNPKFTQLGVGYARAKNGQFYFTQNFCG